MGKLNAGGGLLGGAFRHALEDKANQRFARQRDSLLSGGSGPDAKAARKRLKLDGGAPRTIMRGRPNGQ